MQIRLVQFEVHSFILFLPYFSVFNFKTLFLQLEVGTRFKTLLNENNTRCVIVEIHQWSKLQLRKSIQYFACFLEIPLSISK